MELAAQRFLRQFFASDNFSGRVQQRFQQCKLNVGQLDPLPILRHRPGRGIQLQPIHPQQRRFACGFAAGAAPQDRPYPGQQLARIERLGQVVVRTDLQPHNAVDVVAASSQQKHVDRRGRPDPLQHFKAIEAWKHHVQQDQRVLLLQCFLQSGIASVHRGNMKSIPPEVVCQHRAKLDIVVNEEDFFHSGISLF